MGTPYHAMGVIFLENQLLPCTLTPKVEQLQRKIGKMRGRSHKFLDTFPMGITDAREDVHGPLAAACCTAGPATSPPSSCCFTPLRRGENLIRKDFKGKERKTQQSTFDG